MFCPQCPGKEIAESEIRHYAKPDVRPYHIIKVGTKGVDQQVEIHFLVQ